MKSLFKRQLLPLRWWLLVGFCVMLTVAFGARPALYAYRLNRARRALENHRLDQAFDWLEAAGRRTPESSEVQFLLARAHRKLGRLKTARRHLESAWKLGYSKAAIEREQWMAKAQSGELSDVEPKLKAHLAQSGEDTQEICEALVNGYLRNYDFAAARNWVDAWQSDFPTAAQPHYCRGVIWRYLRWYAKATDEFTKALALDPERSDIRLELAKNLELQDSFDAALEHYRICCEQRADDPQAMSGLANCLSRLGEHSEAQTLYQRILDRWPEQVGARLGLAKLDLAAGRAEEAVRRLRPTVREYPHRKELRYVLASALQAIGERDEAKPHFAFVREANKALSRMQQLMEDVQVNPKLVEPRYEIGMALLQYASPAEGAAWLRGVLELDPHHRPTHRALADYYAQRKEPRLAEEHRRQADAANQAEDGS